MRSYIFVLISIIILTACESTDKSEPIIISEDYYKAWYDYDWDKIANLLHPEALENFRTNILLFGGLIDSNYNTTSYFDSLLSREQESLNELLKFLSDTTSQTLNGKEFFTTYCEKVYPSKVLKRNALVPDAIETLGFINEGSDTSHVLTRLTVTKGGTQLSGILVLTLKRDKTIWKVLLPKDLENRLKMQLALKEKLNF